MLNFSRPNQVTWICFTDELESSHLGCIIKTQINSGDFKIFEQVDRPNNDDVLVTFTLVCHREHEFDSLDKVFANLENVISIHAKGRGELLSRFIDNSSRLKSESGNKEDTESDL